VMEEGEAGNQRARYSLVPLFSGAVLYVFTAAPLLGTY
jgi:hypothetical protein